MQANEVIGQVLPQFFPKDWLDSPGMIFSEFPSRICIGYVLRADGRYSYIVDKELSTWSIPREELHAAALANLAKLPSARISIGKVPGGSEGWISAEDDNFAAVRIILPQVQGMFHEALGEQFLVSLPHRDDCFCWSLAQPKERKERHIRDAMNAFLHEKYNLTPDILLCSHGSFRMYAQQSGLQA